MILHFDRTFYRNADFVETEAGLLPYFKYRIKGGCKFNSLIIFSDKCLCVCTQAWLWVWTDRQKGQRNVLVPNNPTSSLAKP